MESFGIGIRLILLVAGILLTVLTLLRMRSGQIALPRWTSAGLAAFMIVLLLVTVAGMLPPSEVIITNPLVNEETHIVTPDTAPK